MLTQPFISVLLPTRQRPNLVISSVTSILSLAKNPGSIEIAVAYDDDDHESHALFQSEEWHDLINKYHAHQRVFQTPRWGYGALHNYYNLMCKETSSDWLLAWNDDASMLTQDWDQHVRDAGDFMGLLHIECTTYPVLSLFPLFPRAWVDFFGEATACNHIDSWILDICTIAGAIKNTGIEVYHDRFSETGNNNDQTYQERSWEGKKMYKSQAMRDLRGEWAQRLIEYRQSLEVLPHVSPTLS